MTKVEKVKNKKRKYWIRRFVKEIKRVRYPSQKTNWVSFAQILIFAVIFTAVVTIFSTLVTLLWNVIGVK